MHRKNWPHRREQKEKAYWEEQKWLAAGFDLANAYSEIPTKDTSRAGGMVLRLKPTLTEKIGLGKARR